MIKKLLGLFTMILFFLSLGCAIQENGKEDGRLHVPSPEWKDQIMYFIVIN